MHYWDWTTRPARSAPAAIVLLQGRYAGEGNQTALQLHGVPVTIRSLHGPEATLLDCARGDNLRWGALFASGETSGVEVSGFSLRKCLTESQMMRALSDHPEHAAHIAGAARWPPGRQGATFSGNRCLAA